MHSTPYSAAKETESATTLEQQNTSINHFNINAGLAHAGPHLEVWKLKEPDWLDVF